MLYVILFSIFISACNLKTWINKELDFSQVKWAAQDITSYKIVVLAVNSIWHAQTIKVEVLNNQVIDHSATCIPAPTEPDSCEIQPYNAEDFTVSGLFAHAIDMTGKQDKKWVEIKFQTKYGYPEQISFDDPEILDEDSTWRVTSFEVVK